MKSISSSYCRRNRNGAFALPDLLVILAVISVLAALSVAIAVSTREKARLSVCLENQRKIGKAILAFSEDNSKALPGPSSPKDNVWWTYKEQVMTQKEGRFTLNPTTVITGNKEEALHLTEVLRKGTGFPLEIVSDAPATNFISLTVTPALKESLGLEGYRLSVFTGRVEISAASDAGLFYGGVTLCQLLPPAVWAEHPVSKTNDWSVPCVEIEDFPEHDRLFPLICIKS